MDAERHNGAGNHSDASGNLGPARVFISNAAGTTEKDVLRY